MAETTKKPKFQRRTGSRFSKLGKGRKKLQKWRKPTGRDNKMREKRKGYPKVVQVGYKQDVKVRGEIEEKKPVMIMNVKSLDKIKENEIGIIGKVGNKKKIEIAKVVKEKKIEIHNLNTKKFLKQMEKIKKQKDEKKLSAVKKVEKMKTDKKKEESKSEDKNVGEKK